MPHRESRWTPSRTPGVCARGARYRGFTLLEVVVALAISGIVLLGARQMLEVIAASTDRINAQARAADRTANAERLLRALVGRLEVGTQGAGDFVGTERATSFTSWCDVPGGWQERCAVTLAVDTAGGRPVLAALLAFPGRPGAREEVIVLRDDLRDGVFRYLSDAGAGGTWFRAWGRGITAPLAVGVVLVPAHATNARATSLDSEASVAETPAADTLILRIGERG